MNFEECLTAMKDGKLLRREKWHKNECVFLLKGAHDFQSVPDATHVEGIPMTMFEAWGKGIVTHFPSFRFTTKHGHLYDAWMPTIVDILSEDWETKETIEEI